MRRYALDLDLQPNIAAVVEDGDLSPRPDPCTCGIKAECANCRTWRHTNPQRHYDAGPADCRPGTGGKPGRPWGAAFTRIRHTIRAMMVANDLATSPYDKQFLSRSLVMRRANSNVPTIRDYFTQYQAEIDAHNAAHGLTVRDNWRNEARRRRKCKEVTP